MCGMADFKTDKGLEVEFYIGYYGGRIKVSLLETRVPERMEFSYDLADHCEDERTKDSLEVKAQAKLEMTTFLLTLKKQELVDILLGIVEHGEES